MAVDIFWKLEDDTLFDSGDNSLLLLERAAELSRQPFPQPTMGNLQRLSPPKWQLQIKRESGEMLSIYLDKEPVPKWSYGQLGEVGNFNTVVTTNFNIPRNSQTEAFFEYMTKFNAKTNIYKRDLFCNLVYAGEVMIDNAKLETIKYTKNEFQLILSGDNALLIDLSSGYLTDLDFGEANFTYPSNPQFNNIYSVWWRFLLFYGRSAGTDADLLDTPPPALSLKYIYDKILSTNGITASYLSGINWYASNEFEYKLWLQLGSFKNDYSDYDASATFNVSQFSGYLAMTLTPSAGEYFSHFSQIIAPSFNGVVVNKLCTTTVEFYYERNAGFVGQVLFQHLDTDHVTVLYEEEVFPNLNISISRDVQAGQHIGLKLYNVTASIIVTNSNISFKAGGNTQVGSVYQFNQNLPKIKQIDVLKYIAKRYAQLTDFDPVTNTLIWYDLATLEANAANAIDITQYIVSADEVVIDYVGDNAQVNRYQYDNKNDVDITVNEGVILFDNVNIDADKVNYKAPFATSKQAANGICIIECISDTGEFTDFEPRLTRESASFFSIAENTSVEAATNTSISWNEIIAASYAEYTAALDDLKIIPIQANIPMPIVKKMISKKYKYPILIDYSDGETQISGLFKLNSIDYYKGKPCNVELMQLRPI